MTTEFPPDTADGWAVLHELFTVNWQKLAAAPQNEVEQACAEAAEWMKPRETFGPAGQSAAFNMLGHKGQFMILHYADTFDRCAELERQFLRTKLAGFLTLSDSFVSVVEMGMYHVTKKTVEQLEAKGLERHSPEWTAAYEEKIEPHKENLNERRYTKIPDGRYFCFYPMSKRRAETHNWYRQPIARRAELMMEHGMSGRRFAGKVFQVISGSMGFDDWEWGVDLFSNDPLELKKIVSDMRFDEVSALYGEFGKFYFGLRLPSETWHPFFAGQPLHIR